MRGVRDMSPPAPIDTSQKPRFPNLPDPSGARIGSGNSRYFTLRQSEVVRYRANERAVFSESGPKMGLCPNVAHICVFRPLKFSMSTVSRAPRFSPPPTLSLPLLPNPGPQACPVSGVSGQAPGEATAGGRSCGPTGPQGVALGDARGCSRVLNGASSLIFPVSFIQASTLKLL